MSIRSEVRDAERKLETEAAHVVQAVNESFPEIQNIKENVRGLTKSIKATTADGAHAATEYVHDRMDDLRDSGTDTLRSVERHIKEKPGQSVAIAFAAGLIASLLLGRR